MTCAVSFSTSTPQKLAGTLLLTDRNSHRAYPTKILSRNIIATLCCTSGKGGAGTWRLDKLCEAAPSDVPPARWVAVRPVCAVR